MITKKEAQHIAKLARLDLKEKEMQKFQKEFSVILNYFASLKKLDVSKVEPTFQSVQSSSEAGMGGVKEDSCSPFSKTEKLIQMSPEKKKRYVRVKAIL
ncbi:Asp-tRNA(Asn)/Glu-tRNA(Gln) amidotransferase subunit GatC [Patescibacteria group bacterium]